jgi:hypothetical protein
MSKVTVWLKDEINCVILGLSPEQHENLYDKFGYKTKNYFFNPRYKLGVWDGKLRFYNKSGSTYIYLLNKIIPQLMKWKCDIELKDDRKSIIVTPELVNENMFAHIKNEHGDPYKLRWYQVEALNAVLTHNGGIMKAGTGAGKTIIGAALSKTYENLGLKTITIVPSKSLVTQSSLDYKMWGLDCGQYCGDIKELGHTHMVTTWQSLQNVPTILKDYDVVNVDECLSENTMISIPGGAIKIKDMKKGDKIYSVNPDMSVREDEVVKVHINLKQSNSHKMFRLEGENGEILEVTGNHKVLTKDGMVQVYDLSEGDEILDNFINSNVIPT